MKRVTRTWDESETAGRLDPDEPNAREFVVSWSMIVYADTPDDAMSQAHTILHDAVRYHEGATIFKLEDRDWVYWTDTMDGNLAPYDTRPRKPLDTPPPV